VAALNPANPRVTPDVVVACSGDVPMLETLTAVSILREQMPDLKIRVVNAVDLMKLQRPTEHPHGLSDMGFDELFTRDNTYGEDLSEIRNCHCSREDRSS
jgi:phosphoketolase